MSGKSEPILKVEEGGYYVAIWFLDGHEANYLAMLYRRPNEATLTLSYRFRYFRDERIFGSDDVKTAFDASLAGKTEAEAIAIVDSMVAGLVRLGFTGSRLPWKAAKNLTRRIIRGDLHAFWKVVSGLPFVHMTTEDRARMDETPERKDRN